MSEVSLFIHHAGVISLPLLSTSLSNTLAAPPASHYSGSPHASRMSLRASRTLCMPSHAMPCTFTLGAVTRNVPLFSRDMHAPELTALYIRDDCMHACCCSMYSRPGIGTDACPGLLYMLRCHALGIIVNLRAHPHATVPAPPEHSCTDRTRYRYLRDHRRADLMAVHQHLQRRY